MSRSRWAGLCAAPGYAFAVAVVVGYAAAKLYAKPGVGTDLGYGAYADGISRVTAAAESAIVFTDYKLLPHDLRTHERIAMWWSEIYGPIPREVMTSGRFRLQGRVAAGDRYRLHCSRSSSPSNSRTARR